MKRLVGWELATAMLRVWGDFSSSVTNSNHLCTSSIPTSDTLAQMVAVRGMAFPSMKPCT